MSKKKKSIVGWICKKDSIYNVLGRDRTFIVINDYFFPYLKKGDLLNDLDEYEIKEGVKKVRITISEI
jgi:hypothetical protein